MFPVGKIAEKKQSVGVYFDNMALCFEFQINKKASGLRYIHNMWHGLLKIGHACGIHLLFF